MQIKYGKKEKVIEIERKILYQIRIEMNIRERKRNGKRENLGLFDINYLYIIV